MKSLSGAQLAVGEDPVAAHFEGAFKSLQGVDLGKAKADPKGSLAERVAFAQQAKEAEFRQSFMVTAAEASEVKSLASKAPQRRASAQPLNTRLSRWRCDGPLLLEMGRPRRPHGRPRSRR